MSNAATSQLDPGLVAAYRAAQYQVSAGSRSFTMSVDVHSAALADCHRRHRVECSAFLTAWNPRSVRVSRSMNVAAAVTLEQRLRTLGYPLLVGRALDPRGVWEPEESMLVLGIARSDACAIGRDFGQAGFLYAGHDAVPRLVLVE